MPKSKTKPETTAPPASSRGKATPSTRRKKTSEREGYDEFREQQAEISRKKSKSGREIGPLRKVKNKARRDRCRLDLRKFCETYLKQRFFLAWSKDHLRAIEKLQRCVLKGGLYAYAMPRSTGKTELVEAAILWAVLFGHRRFVVVIGSTKEAAEDILDSITEELEDNDLLDADFPEVCQPIRALEGIRNRSQGQILDGDRTRLELRSSRVIMPTVKGSACSGSVIIARGLTGALRGLKRKLKSGRTIRPDFAILDDPQTDESATSESQTQDREQLVKGAVLGLAGVGKKIACAMPCTVIAPNDLSDRMLDPERNPRWGGERARMVYEFPTNKERWDEYADLRRESYRQFGDSRLSDELYRTRRAEMDAGCVVAWPERFDDDELSGVQHAMNKKIDDPRSFAAECQNEPEADVGVMVSKMIDPDAVAARLSGVPRGQVPRECTRLVAFIDCGIDVLWYTVAAFDERFGGGIVNYGAWPHQNRTHFTARDASPSLREKYPGLSDDQLLYRALAELTSDILGRQYPRHGSGIGATVERCLIDEGWKDGVVYQFCRESPFRNVLLPSKGMPPKLHQRGMNEWPVKPGSRKGDHWRVEPVGTGKGTHAIFDPDFWKTFTAERLTVPPGGGGDLKLFGETADAHRLIAEHLDAETATFVNAGGRQFDKWAAKPNRNNHLLDTAVGCVLAASIQGLQWSASGTPIITTAPKQKKLSELADERERSGRRGRS